MANATFECGLCADRYLVSQRVWIYTNGQVLDEEDCMCRLCTTSSFQDAYSNVTDDPNLGWGVTWGPGNYLQARDYVSVLGEDFVARYEARQREYDIPREARVYCPHKAAPTNDLSVQNLSLEGNQACGGFVAAATSDMENSQARCSECDKGVCLTCRGAIDLGGPSHECPGPPQAEQREDVLPTDWERGVHYQHCPKCAMTYAHLEACNYIVCSVMTCGTGFCFICGEEAIHKRPYTHWLQTTDGSEWCPLWGRRGDPRAHTNDPDDLEPELRWFQVDMIAFKASLAHILAQYDPPMPYPKWITNKVSDDWNLIYQFEDDVPIHVVCRFPNSSLPLTLATYREQTFVEAMERYMLYDERSRLFSTIQYIRDNTADALIEVNEPNSDWQPDDLQRLWDVYHNPDGDAHSLTPLDVVTFFLLMERVSGVVNDCSWTQYVPRGTRILYWISHPDPSAPESSNQELSVTFGMLASETDDEHPEQHESLEKLERLLLNNPQRFLQSVVALRRSTARTHALPPPPWGHERPEWKYFTMTVECLRYWVAEYMFGVPPDVALVPKWWQHPDMPIDDIVIIRWIRDGQASEPFEGAEITGIFRDNPKDEDQHLALETLCRFIWSRERPGKVLQQTLYLADIDDITGETTVEELRHNENYREFQNGRLDL